MVTRLGEVGEGRLLRIPLNYDVFWVALCRVEGCDCKVPVEPRSSSSTGSWGNAPAH